MNFNEYQKKALETAIYPSDMGIVYTALGLASEAGEVAGKVKKVIRDNGGVFDDAQEAAIMDEISDCIWYIATLAHEIGFDLNAVAEHNLAKLSARKNKGTISGSGDNR